MTTGNWYNSDGLPLQFGTSKANFEPGGDYSFAGPNRIMELDLDASTSMTGAALSTTAQAISLGNLFLTGNNIQLEKVELIGETAIASGPTSFSLGLASGNPFTAGGLTTISDTAFLATISPWTAGNLTTYTLSSTGAGAFIGEYLSTTNHTTPGWITAKIAGSAGSGKARVRIFYHGAGTIPN